jgi:imidazolonepropionase
MVRKLFRNARIYTPRDPGEPLRGRDQGSLTAFPEGALLVEDGLLAAIGPEKEVLDRVAGGQLCQEVDLEGMCVIPGLIDPHTHMCFVGTREREFQMRCEGTSYLEILAAGGGILSTVQRVRQAREEELLAETTGRMRKAMAMGTTTLEVKSGYGLNIQDELKMLRVIDRGARLAGADVSPTFLGAHAIPPEFKNSPGEYVDLVVEEMLPRVSQQGIARFCDVFCEEGVFSPDETRRILRRARSLGLGLKIHADEIKDTGGAKLAAELEAVSAEHLLAASNEGLKAMAEKGVIAILLPATALSLRKPYARAREMIQMGVPVALATDCNPGSSYTNSMLLVMALAVLGMGLSAEEALVASTINGAYAIGMAQKVGTLEVGKQADFVVLDGETPWIIPYSLGAQSSVRAVYKRGERVS